MQPSCAWCQYRGKPRHITESQRILADPKAMLIDTSKENQQHGIPFFWLCLYVAVTYLVLLYVVPVGVWRSKSQRTMHHRFQQVPGPLLFDPVVKSVPRGAWTTRAGSHGAPCQGKRFWGLDFISENRILGLFTLSTYFFPGIFFSMLKQARFPSFLRQRDRVSKVELIGQHFLLPKINRFSPNRSISEWHLHGSAWLTTRCIVFSGC